ncbi:hypothetical protein JTE90_020194 [Oedothorax gibbosus]|uniref:Uncharacterized protein n=1 Tax=Oedothorax gibbosus TaxID=931172 RepID=A0AAV6U1I4_9ARAC|nr:hypothetical protein JTE90_020194 [Oedothorax gibbosus]
MGHAIGQATTSQKGFVPLHTYMPDYTYNTSNSVLQIVTGSCSVCYFVPVGIIDVCNFLIIRAANRSGKKNNQPMFVRRHSDFYIQEYDCGGGHLTLTTSASEKFSNSPILGLVEKMDFRSANRSH